MPEYQIESGVPLPTPTPRSKYPFGLLKPGQSFLVPRSDEKGCRNVGAALTRFKKAAERDDLISRTVADGVRVFCLVPEQAQAQPAATDDDPDPGAGLAEPGM